MKFLSATFIFHLVAIIQPLLFPVKAFRTQINTRLCHAPSMLKTTKKCETALFAGPPTRKPLMKSDQSDRRTRILKSAAKVLSERTGIELTLLEEFRKFTIGLCGKHSTVPVPFGKMICGTCDVGERVSFGVSADELIHYLEAGASVLIVVYNPTTMDFPFVYFLAPDHLPEFKKAIEESGVDGSIEFQPSPYGIARSGLTLLMERYRYSLEDDSTSLRYAMTHFAASPTCPKKTLSFLNSDSSMDGAIENMIKKSRKENPKGTVKKKVLLHEAIAAFFEYLGLPMKELAKCSKYGVFFGTDDQQAAPYGKMLACNYQVNGQVNFSIQVGEIVDLLSDKGCVILLVLNGTSGSFDYAYLLTPDDLPKLKKSIAKCDIKTSSQFAVLPGSLPKKGSVSCVMKDYLYAFSDSNLKNKLLNFLSAQKTRRETSRFLETDPSMVPSVNDQITNACRALVQKFFSAAEESTLVARKATPILNSKNEAGYYTTIRAQAGLVMDADEVSALAVVMPRNNTSDQRVRTSPDHYGTIVLLATRTTDGRIALGGTNIGKKVITFTWNAEQQRFGINENIYNRGPRGEKDWVVLTLPDSSDPEYEAKMAAVLSLASETLAAFASRPPLTAVENQKCKRAVDFEEENEKKRTFMRGYRKAAARAPPKVSQQLGDEEGKKKRNSKRVTRASAGPQEVVLDPLAPAVPPCVAP